MIPSNDKNLVLLRQAVRQGDVSKLNLEGVATLLQRQRDMESELQSLRKLASLGLSVERDCHDFESNAMHIQSAMDRLPAEVRETQTYTFMRDTFQQLVERQRFLTPMCVSSRHWTPMSGTRVKTYLLEYFSKRLSREGLHLEITDRFTEAVVEGENSTMLHVFVNLLTNAFYWVEQKDGSGKVRLDRIAGAIVVTDDGPGVADEDVGKLFTPFFSRRVRGGRGIGLHLCQVHLKNNMYQIEYVKDYHDGLGGATFVIERLAPQ